MNHSHGRRIPNKLHSKQVYLEKESSEGKLTRTSSQILYWLAVAAPHAGGQLNAVLCAEDGSGPGRPQVQELVTDAMVLNQVE